MAYPEITIQNCLAPACAILTIDPSIIRHRSGRDHYGPCELDQETRSPGALRAAILMPEMMRKGLERDNETNLYQVLGVTDVLSESVRSFSPAQQHARIPIG